MKIKRSIAIVIENEVVGDGMWSPSVLSALREYVSQCEAGTMGTARTERLNFVNGNILTARLMTYVDGRAIYDPEEYL